MMSEENTGGAAFPVLELLTKNGDVAIEAERGMTLRDYFAAKAMQGLLASPREIADGGEVTDKKVADTAYIVADAMLKAREE